MDESLFSYGTLQKDEVQLDLFGRFLDGEKDVLAGYRLALIEIKDESFLSKGEKKFQLTLIQTENAADIVEGTVFEITPAELLLADEYEPENYKRIKVALASGRESWIYIAA